MEKMREIVNQTGIGETHNLEKYPRFPIIHKGRRRNEFQFVVERVQAKLAGWKSKSLSLAGRLVLIKAVVSLIPEYNMQCYKLSKCKRRSDFLFHPLGVPKQDTCL